MGHEGILTLLGSLDMCSVKKVYIDGNPTSGMDGKLSKGEGLHTSGLVKRECMVTIFYKRIETRR